MALDKAEGWLELIERRLWLISQYFTGHLMMGILERQLILFFSTKRRLYNEAAALAL